MKKMVHLVCSCLVLLAVTLPCTYSVRAQDTDSQPDPMTTGPAPKGKPWEPAWGFWPNVPKAWQQTHWGFVSDAKKGNVDILFLGDSITKGWSGAGKEVWQKTYVPLKGLNIGIGGDTTRQTLWRIDHEALNGIQPKLVVLMIGVNNIFTGTGSDEEIAQGIQEVLKQIQVKCPSTKILLLGILPLGNESQTARAKQINTTAAGFASGNVRFLDLFPTFLDASGKVIPELYSPDLVHLAAPGYVAWNGVMQPVIEEMLK